MKKKIKIVLSLLICLGLTGFPTESVYAGGLSVNASPRSVSVGSNFNVNVGVTGTSLISDLNAVCNGCTIISGISESIYSGESKTVVARLDSAAGATVTINGFNSDGDTNTEYSVSASAYVSATTSGGGGSSSGGGGSSSSGSTMPDPDDTIHSSDNNLKGLSVSEGELTPAFSADVTDYTVNLPASSTAITINAEVNDAKATVSGTGEKALEPGDNVFEIAVTAENLTVKAYKVNVIVDEKPLVYTKFNGKKLGVVRTIKNAPIPANFVETTVKLEGKEIPAWKNDAMKKTIVYLVDEKNNKQFYLFEDGKITSTFTYVKLLGKEAFVIDIEKDNQEKTGLEYKKIKIDNQEVMGWTFEDTSMSNYQVVYLMDLDGATRYYQHEKSQNTLQLYSGAAPTTQSNYAKQINDLKNGKLIFLIWAGGATLLLIGGAGVFAYQYTKKNKKA